MRLKKAHVRNYRSILDSGEFEVEAGKSIFVGPNEAGKSAILEALQQIRRPEGVAAFDPLRDYPRALYNDITTGKVHPDTIPVVTGWFELEDDDLAAIAPDLAKEPLVYVFTRYLSDKSTHHLEGAPPTPTYQSIEADIKRLAKHVDAQQQENKPPPSELLNQVTAEWKPHSHLTKERREQLGPWLNSVVPLIDEANETEEKRLEKIRAILQKIDDRESSLTTLYKRLPLFVLFNNYFRVRPTIHLGKLAQRIASNAFDDAQYDYGNVCLLKLLGLSADSLSKMAKSGVDQQGKFLELDSFRDELDKRHYQLNAAGVRLTTEIRAVWNPNIERGEADRLRIMSDGQYLKVVVEDDLGVEVELDQRSEGFQWLVSFFVVFFAEAEGKHENAILLLDEPGLHLHALKQRDFRETISKLAEKNQTLYTTHSPFLVGPDELDKVRVVELIDRKVGTKVHATITSNDPAALLPLQEALGYDLAQSLFTQRKNLVLEGLTDYWYVSGISSMFMSEGKDGLSETISLIPAGSASKVVYFATILHAQKLKVAALLDGDVAGKEAANQEALVHSLGQKSILLVADYCPPKIKGPGMEDLLRDTLVSIAKAELGSDLSPAIAKSPNRSIVSMMKSENPPISKYQLAKAFLKWSRDHSLSDLTEDERTQWSKLLETVNRRLS